MTTAPAASGSRLYIAAAVTALLLVVGAVLDPARTAAAYLTAYMATLGVALGALALVMIARVTGASWFAVMRPRAESVTATLPLLAVLFTPILFAVHLLYPWAFERTRLAPALYVQILRKTAYLNVPFFVVRAVLYWGTWIMLAELLRRTSRAYTREPDDALARRMYILSAVGLPAFALTVTFAAFDWMMSLSPDWSSTIYGVYVFAGDCVAAVALLAVLDRWPPGQHRALHGAAGTSKAGQLQPLGKLLLTFVMFWAYTGYAQYLVIWIGDLPHEITWYTARSGGGWRIVSTILVFGHFGFPFALLLFHRVRQSPTLLGLVGAWLLVMHYVDTYWLVLPSFTPHVVSPSWLDPLALVAVAGAVAAFGLYRSNTFTSESRGEGPAAGSLRLTPDRGPPVQ